MTITKQDWIEIEEELKSMFVHIEFKLKDDVISVHRVQSGEGKTELGVYINHEIKGTWYLDDKERPACITDVWCEKSKAIYKAKDIKEIEKILGKRAAKKQFPKLHERMVYWVPYFSKASVVVRQFKKIDGLTLIKKESV